MFYPMIFPQVATGLAAEKAMEVQAAAVYFLATAAPTFIQHRWQDLVPALMDELRALDVVAWETEEDRAASEYLSAHLPQLRRLAVEIMGRGPQEPGWHLPAPDWCEVQRLLGEQGANEWRETLARWEADARANARRLAESTAAAPATSASG